MKANPARGEVEVVIDGETYVLAGTFGGLARLQSAVKVQGLGALLALVNAADANALIDGVRCLAIDGDVAKLDKARVSAEQIRAVKDALLTAIVGIQEPDEGNAVAAQARPN